MRKKRFQVLLALLIAFALPLSCAYSYYNAMVEADFLYRGLKFESADLEDLFVDKQQAVDFASLFATATFLEASLSETIFVPSPITPVFDQASSILRC